MKTLMQQVKMDKARLDRIANGLFGAHTSKLEIVWCNNVIYCTIIDKKKRYQEQHRDIERKSFNYIIKRLEEGGVTKGEPQTLQYGAVKFTLKK